MSAIIYICCVILFEVCSRHPCSPLSSSPLPTPLSFLADLNIFDGSFVFAGLSIRSFLLFARSKGMEELEGLIDTTTTHTIVSLPIVVGRVHALFQMLPAFVCAYPIAHIQHTFTYTQTSKIGPEMGGRREQVYLTIQARSSVFLMIYLLNCISELDLFLQTSNNLIPRRHCESRGVHIALALANVIF